MSSNFFNPFNEFNDRIITISDDYPKNLDSLLKYHKINLCDTRVELGNKLSWIDWDSYPGYYCFYYDFHGNEDAVRKHLRNSLLRNCNYILMEFGYQKPLSKISMELFINYWYELVIISGYESVVLTEDGNLFMDFIRRGYLLKSNFSIKPD